MGSRGRPAMERIDPTPTNAAPKNGMGIIKPAKKASYGELRPQSSPAVPTTVKMKETEGLKTDRQAHPQCRQQKNMTGQAAVGIDTRREGCSIVMWQDRRALAKN